MKHIYALIVLTICAGFNIFGVYAQEPCDFIYVTPSGSNSGPATKASPASLVYGLSLANSGPRRHIRMQAGNYAVNQKLVISASNVIIEGGFNTSWEKTSSAATNITITPALETATLLSITVGHLIGVQVHNVSNVQLKDLNITVLNTNIGTFTGRRGHSIYGIHLNNATNFEATRVSVATGNASNGDVATNGVAGAPGANGTCGTVGNCDRSEAEGHGGAGGAGGGGTPGGGGGAIGNEWDDNGCARVTGVNGGGGSNASSYRNGGGGGGGASGGRRGECSSTPGNGGRGGFGGNGGGGASGGSNAGTCSRGGTADCANNGCTGGDIGYAGCNGANGANGTSYSTAVSGVGTFDLFYIPKNGQDGGDGAGGGGGSGGGGGGGENNNALGCSDGSGCNCGADDGSGAGGGGGGGGGQGGTGGQGGGGGGSSICIYVYNSTYTLSQVNTSPGSAGAGRTGGTGGLGGAGGTGGFGGSVADVSTRGGPACHFGNNLGGFCAGSGCSDGETGAGGRGGNGGKGGDGGNGEGGANGVSVGVYQVGIGTVTPTTIASYPGDARAIYNKGCTNSEVQFQKTTAGNWALGVNGNLLDDISSGNSSFALSNNNISAYYTTTGWKDISVGANTHIRKVLINQTRALPVISTIPSSPVCQGSTFNLGTTTTGTNYLWEIQATPVTGPSTPAPVFTSNVQNPTNISITTPGTYQVRLRVYDDCCGWSRPVYGSITIQAAATVPSSITGPTNICQGATPSSFSTPAQSGATSYNWTVTAPNTITSASNNATVTWNSGYFGTAQVCVTAVGCNGSQGPYCENVTVQQAATAPTAPSGSISLCQGVDVSNNYTTSGGGGATSFTWTVTNPNLIAGAGTSANVSWDANFYGSAQVCVSAVGCNGSVGPSCTNITMQEAASVPTAPSGSTSLCQGAPLTTYTTSAGGATTYNWTVTTPNTIVGSGASGAVTWDPGFVGNAQVCVDVIGCNGNFGPTCATVNIGGNATTPTITTAPFDRCIGPGSDVINATATFANNFSWSIVNAGSSTINPNNSLGDEATVLWDNTFVGASQICVSANGCSGSVGPACITVNTYDLVQPPSVPAGILSFCQGTLTQNYISVATNAQNYNWTITGTGNTVTNTMGNATVNFDPQFYGTAQLCVSADGCAGPTIPVCVDIDVVPGAQTPSPPAGDIARCIGPGTSTYVSSAIGATSYLWSISPPTAGTISPTGVVTWNPLFVDTAYVTVVGVGCNGNSAPSTTMVITYGNQPLPTIPAGASTRCQGIGSDIYTTSSPGASSYIWSITPSSAGTISGSTANGVVNWNNSFSGSATICVQAVGCDTTNSVCVPVTIYPEPPKPSVSVLGSTTICPGGSVTLISSSPTNNMWLPDSVYNVQLVVSSGGVYAVVVSDANGCTNISDNVIITESNIPAVASISGPDSVCVNEAFKLTASSAQTYLWNNNETTQEINPAINTPTTFTVTITDGGNCSGSASKTVYLYPYPVAADDNAITNHNTSIDISVINNDNANGTISVLTPPVNGSVQVNGQVISYTPNDQFSGTDQFTYILCSPKCANQCDTATVTVIVRDGLFIPNGFSPNGDGVNDLFEIVGLDNFPDNELLILNRWGDAVYRAKPYNNDWNGTSNTGIGGGGRLTDGTYFFVFKTSPDSEPIRGYIELKR